MKCEMKNNVRMWRKGNTNRDWRHAMKAKTEEMMLQK